MVPHLVSPVTRTSGTYAGDARLSRDYLFPGESRGPGFLCRVVCDPGPRPSPGNRV